MPSCSPVARRALTLLLGLSAMSACSNPSERTLTVFAAASLGPTLDLLKPQFEAKHPGVRINVEVSGSRLACTKVSEQRREADLVLSADFELIDELLVPNHAGFNVLFGNNSLVLAYTPRSPIAEDLKRGAPWQEVLARPEVSVGIANPRQAPVGYRALLALQLNDQVAPEPLRNGVAIAQKIKPEHQRPDVTKLVAPLEAGELDAAFVYLSEARQHGLPFVKLDPRVDFSSLDHQELYGQASVTLPAEGQVKAQAMRGAASIYGLTIPKSAPHADLAAALVTLLLSTEGREIAERAHMDLFTPAELAVHGTLPSELGALAKR